MYILYVCLLLQLFILVNCPPGSHGVTGSTCAQCTIDTFQDQQGQVTCRSCPSDQGTLSTGAVECTGDNNSTSYYTSCSDNYVALLTYVAVAITHSMCVPVDICAAGSYSTTGLSPCTLCPADTYQSSQRSALCIDCPPGTVAPNGSANCTGEDIGCVTIEMFYS